MKKSMLNIEAVQDSYTEPVDVDSADAVFELLDLADAIEVASDDVEMALALSGNEDQLDGIAARLDAAGNDETLIALYGGDIEAINGGLEFSLDPAQAKIALDAAQRTVLDKLREQMARILETIKQLLEKLLINKAIVWKLWERENVRVSKLSSYAWKKEEKLIFTPGSDDLEDEFAKAITFVDKVLTLNTAKWELKNDNETRDFVTGVALKRFRAMAKIGNTIDCGEYKNAGTRKTLIKDVIGKSEEIYKDLGQLSAVKSKFAAVNPRKFETKGSSDIKPARTYAAMSRFIGFAGLLSIRIVAANTRVLRNVR